MADANDDQDKYITTPEEGIDVDDVSPEKRREQYGQQEGREVADAFPRPSDDGDDADDEDDREP